jgi:hypothetical protein
LNKLFHAKLKIRSKRNEKYKKITNKYDQYTISSRIIMHRKAIVDIEIEVKV